MTTQIKHRSFLLGTCYMVLSATSFSIAYLFAKLSIEKINFFPLVFLRFIIPLFLLIPLFVREKRLPRTKHLRVHLLRTFFVLTSQYSIFYYITKGTLMDAAVLLNTAPLFIPLIEWFFLNHRIPKSTWISVAIGAVGVICVLQPGISLFTSLSFFGLLAGFSQGFSQVIYGLNVRRESTGTNLFYLYCIGSIFSLVPLPFIAWKFPSVAFFHSVVTFELIVFVFLLSFASVSNQYFRGKAYQQKKPSTLSSFLYLSVPVAALFDWLVFNTKPNSLSIVGASLIVLGGISKVFLRYIFLKRKRWKASSG